MVAIRKTELPVLGIEALRAEASDEGYNFLDTLVEEWESGENRFDGSGETLLGGWEAGTLIAVGGLNCDPFLGSAAVGRIRRVYVRPAWRGRGVGRTLITALLEEARNHFEVVRLRAENAGAARLYERLGFAKIEDAHATHRLQLATVLLGTGTGPGA